MPEVEKILFLAYLVVVDQLLKLVSVHHDVEAAHLGQSELLAIHAGEAHLFPGAGAVSLAGAIDSGLVLPKVHQS